MPQKDPWPHIRKRHQHFKPIEKAYIVKQFKAGIGVTDLARELQCSTRSIQVHYNNLRKKLRINPLPDRKPVARRRPTDVPVTVRVKRPAPPKHTRFYSSNFEPS